MFCISPNIWVNNTQCYPGVNCAIISAVQKERQPSITFKEVTKDGMIAFEFITSKAKAISMQVDCNTTPQDMAKNLVRDFQNLVLYV